MLCGAMATPLRMQDRTGLAAQSASFTGQAAARAFKYGSSGAHSLPARTRLVQRFGKVGRVLSIKERHKGTMVAWR